MKKFLLSMLASCALLFPGASAQPVTPLRVVVFLSPECPLCQNYTLPLNQLQKQYAGKVAFEGVVPGKAYSAAEVKAFSTKYHLAFPVTIDSSKSLSTALKATITPEVFLLGPKNEILYHGSIDNWIKDLGMQRARPTVFYLQDAIDQSLAHRPVRIPYNKPVGCLINDY